MTTYDQTTELPTVRPARRRIQGLKMPALPSNPLLAQLAGGVSALGGVYLAWGVPATMIVGGVVAALLGALREAGKV